MWHLIGFLTSLPMFCFELLMFQLGFSETLTKLMCDSLANLVSSGSFFKFAVLPSSSWTTVSFPHEAIRGSDFFSAQVDAFPYHEWPKATSDSEMHQRVLIKSQTRELPHVEKAFSNVAINKLVNLKIPWKLKNSWNHSVLNHKMTRRKSLNGRSVFNFCAKFAQLEVPMNFDAISKNIKIL